MTERPQRFTRVHPCPVCGGHDALARGQGVRCFGYLDASGDYARCTREDRAGGLPQNRDGTYSHWLHGDCRCGCCHVAPGVCEPAKLEKARRRSAPQSFRSFFTLSAFLRRIYGEDCTVRSWTYEDAEVQEVFRILRIDHEDGTSARAKTYRPCHQGSDTRWRLGKPAGLLPLYHLPAVLASPPAIVPVFEGEKCADIARGLGLLNATTSAHGAQAPQLTDWTPLAGRMVAIFADEGEAGADYASKVRSLLSELSPPPTLATLWLPGLRDGEDIEQWAEGRRKAGLCHGQVSAELLALISSAFA
jgi:hypothetical protein